MARIGRVQPFNPPVAAKDVALRVKLQQSYRVLAEIVAESAELWGTFLTLRRRR